ncbi:DUF3775 domain-containing protein [Aquicoccus sp. G2-2]|uniref:DUF3775 domain-containing protein n=1 Tax=Aquicoccus sp. G2-2 TaxID=3092120 RepID=UPI002ADF08C9|nr:DUF3775 domain-containing protein [Aquicoccus sp. G2-2]MEA1115132.1 DUF3775 domain-containing protein [Aquicoccus sp. G2-2]
MLDISVHRIAQVILMARELKRAENELRGFIERMTDEEQVSLVAVMWIGREAFTADELEEAKETARREATIPTVDYLLGTPHLSDHLENGLEELGLSAADDEDDLVRKG